MARCLYLRVVLAGVFCSCFLGASPSLADGRRVLVVEVSPPDAGLDPVRVREAIGNRYNRAITLVRLGRRAEAP